jgi:hypothetical protein
MIDLKNLELPGAQVQDNLYDFLNEATVADYVTADGECLVEAIEALEKMACRTPDYLNQKGDGELLRIAVYSLVADCHFSSSFDRTDCIRGIAARLKKEDVVRAMSYFAECVNEYYRLRWIVVMRGGWRKENESEVSA